MVGTAPTQTGPTDGSLQRGNDLLFTWNGVDAATDYRFERRLVGGGGAESVRTPALAWAPSLVGDGLWEWRVVSLDSAGAEIGSSPWWQFSVDQKSPTVVKARPTGSVKRAANFVVVFSEPVSNVSKSSFKITPSNSKRKLSAVVKPSADGTKAVLNPVAKLRKGKSYVVTVTSKVNDGAENRLVPYQWTVTAK